MIDPKFIGIPYIKGGREISKDGGLDCYGLVRKWYSDQYGIILPEYRLIHSTGTSLNTTEKPQDISQDFDETDKPVLGDLILFNILGNPMHIAVYIDKNTMLHTFKTGGSVLERFTNLKWSRRLESFYRYSGDNK